MDIYGDNRSTIESMIFESMKSTLGDRDIIVESLLIRDIEIPEDLSTAIKAKKAAEQEVMQMAYVLESERVEKDRKIVEAEGIADANEIIAAELTEEYLLWYWIENLDSHNSVIYVPINDNGLPLIKDVDNT
jgi:regulator of protease activity HflC (stomatin/prohibitin superfamily)